MIHRMDVISQLWSKLLL